MHRSAPTYVSPHQYLASLGNLAPDELRKAKLLYLRNELTSLRQARSASRAFGFVQIIFAIIPVFWPILLLQRHTIKGAINTQAELIRNALAVWSDDLGPEAQAFEAELQQILG
jgi:hypothetical protein